MRSRHLLTLMLLWSLAGPATAQTVVRFQTDFGDIDVQLFDSQTPTTVGNFLNYVDDRDYRRTFVHRSVIFPRVIQGGGFLFINQLFSVPLDPPIAGEIGIANVRGTLAMATGVGPVSTTSQWYINVNDNLGLDANFTVFGAVIAGMGAVDAIASLPTFSVTPFPNLPLRNFMAPFIPDQHLVFTYRVLRVADGQCGDTNDDLVVDDLDAELLRMHLVDPLGVPLTAEGLDKCDTIGTPGSCDVQDLAVLLRDLRGRAPRIAPVCFAAAP